MLANNACCSGLSPLVSVPIAFTSLVNQMILDNVLFYNVFYLCLISLLYLSAFVSLVLIYINKNGYVFT